MDAYGYGILLFEAFNGDFVGSDQAGQTKNIPPTMHSSYRRLVNSNPKARISVANFLDQGRRNNGFFSTPLIKLTESVDNLGMKSEEEREEFLKYFIQSICVSGMLMIVVIWKDYQMTFRKITSR